MESQDWRLPGINQRTGEKRDEILSIEVRSNGFREKVRTIRDKFLNHQMEPSPSGCQSSTQEGGRRVRGRYGERIIALKLVLDGKVIHDYKEEQE